jgi:hypothetical protein
MTLRELRHNVITQALKKHKGNSELAALEVGVTPRTIYTFKAKQKQDKLNQQ